MHVCMPSHFSHVWLFVTPWTVVIRAPLSLGFSRQEYWSRLPFPSPEKPGRLQSMGSLRVRQDWTTSFRFSLSCTGEGNGSPLQCSCLENPRDGGAWWAAVRGVAQGRTRLKRLSSSSPSPGSSQPRDRTWGLLHWRQILYRLSHQGILLWWPSQTNTLSKLLADNFPQWSWFGMVRKEPRPLLPALSAPRSLQSRTAPSSCSGSTALRDRRFPRRWAAGCTAPLPRTLALEEAGPPHASGKLFLSLSSEKLNTILTSSKNKKEGRAWKRQVIHSCEGLRAEGLHRAKLTSP